MKQQNNNMNSNSIYDNDSKKLKKAVAILRALDHPTRQAMINFIMERQGITRTELKEVKIFSSLHLSDISKNWNILVLAKIGYVIKRGKYHHYHIDKKEINRLGKVIDNFINNN